MLGIVQGLSEFLPISSSGHLQITRWLLGWDDLTGSPAAAFDVAVHVGTLVGALSYLRCDVTRYTAAALSPLLRRRALGSDGCTGWNLAASAGPAAVVGVLFGGTLTGSVRMSVVAGSLIFFGLLLGWTDRWAENRDQRRSTKDLRFGTAILLGLAQALALQPGVSRSGAVITAARALGFDRESAVRVAFLMSIPVIAGAGAYGLIGLKVHSALWTEMAWGAAAAAITGWVAVWGTVRVAARVGFLPFAVYRVAMGLALLIALALGWR